MKAKQLLVAALLLGGMTAFNACSNDEIDNVTPPVEQPADGVETYLTLSTSAGNKLQTRAGAVNTNDVKEIKNYAVAIFANNNGTLGKCLAIVTKTATESSPISADGSNFYIDPIKFKTTDGEIAVVVLANCGELFTDAKIADYTAFKTHCEANLLNLTPMTGGNFGGFPMSSDVFTYTVEPGKYNVVDAQSTGMSEAQDFLAEKNITVETAKMNRVGTANIPLYRCWSQVELTELSLKSYNGGVANFELKEVFLMNVPSKTKFFNETAVSSNTWGGSLGYGTLSDYLTVIGNSKGFYSGWMQDKFVVSDNKKEPGHIYYRCKDVAESSAILGYYNRALTTEVILNTGKTATTSLTNVVAKDYKGITSVDANACSYLVPEASYGKGAKGTETDKMMVLVIKGIYTETADGMTTGDTPSYYTIAINNNAIVEEGTLNHSDEVRRNVKYEIKATISGPGSKDDPTVTVPTTNLVPKVTVVPFGKVTQSSTVD